MFDDLAAYFIENVVGSYREHDRVRKAASYGQSRDLRSALVAATALYHLREHVLSPYRKSRSQLAGMCADYGLLGDVVNVAKHRTISTHHPQVTSAEDIFEEVVITEYRDNDGPYRIAETVVEMSR